MNKFIAHILIVDDDDGIRSLVKKYLNENKYLITTSYSAEDASDKIKIVKFDLIILDINQRTLNIEIDPKEIEARKKRYVEPEPRYNSGALYKYSKLVSGSDKGAVTG